MIMMTNFIPFEKLSKKEKKKWNSLKRKDWTMNPVTKVNKDKTKYSRKEKHETDSDSWSYLLL